MEDSLSYLDNLLLKVKELAFELLKLTDLKFFSGFS